MTEGNIITPPRGPRLDSLQVGRALAAEYVLLFHAPWVLSQHLGIKLENRFLSAGHSGVDFFFVLSGFIMFLVHWRDIGRPDRLQRFAFNRFIRIYPVFWVVFAVFVLGQVLIGQLDPQLRGSLSFVQALLLLPFQGMPPLTVAWTLSHELLFYLLLGLCIYLGRGGLIILALWWMCCAAAFLTFPDGTQVMSFPASFLLSPYNLLFAFGMLAAWIYPKLGQGGAVALFVVGLAGFVATIFGDAVLPFGARTVAFGLASAAIVAGIARIEHAGNIRFPKWLVFLGDASYSTYLAHTVALLIGAIVLKKSGIMLNPWLVFALFVVLGTVGGIVLHLVVERPLLAFLRRRRAVVRNA
ncbi:MAG TPA: acyltransferase [Paenirhodobacter sp.]